METKEIRHRIGKDFAEFHIETDVELETGDIIKTEDPTLIYVKHILEEGKYICNLLTNDGKVEGDFYNIGKVRRVGVILSRHNYLVDTVTTFTIKMKLIK